MPHGPATPPIRPAGSSTPPATHRFWAAKNWFPLDRTPDGGPYTMFPEPLAVRTTAKGLLVGYSPRLNLTATAFTHPVQMDFTVGAPGLHADVVTPISWTDRLVTFDFGGLRTTVGRGMPFLYVEAGNNSTISIAFTSPPNVYRKREGQLGVTLGGNHYAFFCPSHASWSQEGNTFLCHLPAGHHYFSLALLTQESDFDSFAPYAFAFPVATRLTWKYDQEKSTVSTHFEVKTQIKEGADPGFLQALYPHQYTALAPGDQIAAQSYTSARGPMRVLKKSSFTTIDTYHGTLPFLPLPDNFDWATEKPLLLQVANEGNSFPAPDTYGQGKSFGRLAQLLPLAAMAHEAGLRDKLATRMRQQFATWSSPSPRRSMYFAYDKNWGSLIGHPASFGSDTALNDHHFHYGYWIHAAAMLGLVDPGWIDSAPNRAFFGEMIRDIANPDAQDARYPMLRHFDAYAGHSWASGQAPFGDGENQESTSEAINAWAGLILYASEIHDTGLRDTAIWMYTLETKAARDYWFNDGPVSTFPAGFAPVQVSNVFDGKADAATWFGDAPAFEHGIQFLPFTGASLYLGRNPAYVRRNLSEVMRVSSGKIDTAGDKWPDLMELYQAFDDPAAAIAAWRNTRFVFDGETKAHEFAWLSSMHSLGHVDDTISANCTFYAIFRSASGERIHVAFNPDAAPIAVRFSDGYKLQVPAHTMMANGRSVSLQ